MTRDLSFWLAVSLAVFLASVVYVKHTYAWSCAEWEYHEHVHGC